MSFVIYTKTGCPYCAAALESLSQKGAAFTEINLTEHPERIPEMIKVAGIRKVPVIIEDDKVTVGFNGGG